MLNVFTLDSGQTQRAPVQEEITSADDLARAQPLWVDLETPTADEKRWIAERFNVTSPTTSWTTTWKNPPGFTRRTTASCTSAPTFRG